MALKKVLTMDLIKLDFNGVDKWAAIEHLVDVVCHHTEGAEKQAILSAVLERERKGTTALHNGIAVPHARTEAVPHLVAAAAISDKGIDFGDGPPCHFIFLILAPPSESTRYLKALASVAALGQDLNALFSLKKATSSEEAYAIVEGVRGLNLVKI
jgi:mannitol/fructose-specific phosphotransferase system IIA component (Ntr-type)